MFARDTPPMTSIAVSPSGVAPAVQAPSGGVSDAASETPRGMGASSDAAIFWFDSFVLMAYVLPATDARVVIPSARGDGALNAGDGADIAVCAAIITLNRTVWVAVCASTRVDAHMNATEHIPILIAERRGELQR